MCDKKKRILREMLLVLLAQMEMKNASVFHLYRQTESAMMCGSSVLPLQKILLNSIQLNSQHNNVYNPK